MYIGFFCHQKFYNKNRLFTDKSYPVGDTLEYPFGILADVLWSQGHKAATIDTDDLENFDAVVFIEFPGLKNKYFKKLIKSGFKNLYLIANESPIIKPDNYIKENHKYFKKVFTWADDLVDNKKYFKINYSQKIPANLNLASLKKEKLCTLISSNKFTKHPKELYTERIKSIRWFEDYHPEQFDLYGRGWDKYYFNGTFCGIKLARLNRFKFLAKILGPIYPSWKGEAMSKEETFRKYKFAICYENCAGSAGYISEKIFDCFFSGCVPIYLGAPNIRNFIPENTFIDKEKFSTYEKLYDYIKNMPDQEYKRYLSAIEEFVKSDKIYPFSAECFAKTISSEITK